MKLIDKLRICLLALESRYPGHVVDINPTVLGVQHTGAVCWPAQDIVEYLELAAPHLLNETASLVIDIQRSEIFLLERSEESPAFIVHCRGRVPGRRSSRPLMDRIHAEQVHTSVTPPTLA